MTIWGFDVDSYNKAGFAFQTARAQGYTCALIKFGGMNLPGNAPYMMNGYHAFAQAALDVGFDIVGDYLVTGGSNPAAAAQFWLRNRHGGLDFHELDNEKLDSGNPFNDGQACVYFDTIGTATDRWMYGSRDSLWNAGSWSGLASRKIKAHVAIYNGSPFQNIVPRTYPAELVLAHQFTSSASIGGLGAIDANAYADHAFVTSNTQTVVEEDMALICAKDQPGKPVFLFAPGYVKHLADPAQEQAAVWSTRLGAADQFDNNDFQRTIWNYGLQEYSFDQVVGLSRGTNPDGTPNTNGGGILWASAVSGGASAAIDYDQLGASIAAHQTTKDLTITLTGKASA